MKWFRRQRRREGKPFDASELPDTSMATVEEATSEGLMLADYANRMKIKNTIIVGVLAEGGSYDPERYIPAATTALSSLAAEFEQAAERIAQQISTIEALPGTATHAHDYRLRDASNLRHREAVLRALVDELHHRLRDRGHLLGLIESAREDAWSDIARAVTDVLDRAFVRVDDAYERDRTKRMRLVSADLRNLMADLDG